MRKYDAVLFDLDGTLRTSQPDGIEAFVECASNIGVALTQEHVAKLEREAHRYWASGAMVDEHMARYDQRGFWVNYYSLLLEAIGVGDCDACGDRIHACLESRHDPDDLVYADTWDVLRRLRSQGYVTGLVSNRDKPVDDYARTIAIADLFDFILVGGQVGSFKPDAPIFLEALKRAGDVRPDRALYVGDNYYADVVGARAVGMHAVLIDRRDVFKHECDARVRHLRDILGLIEG